MWRKMISCNPSAAQRQRNLVLQAAATILFLSSQPQSAIAQCDQVICPPADCSNPIRFLGQCCDICISPPSEFSPLKLRQIMPWETRNHTLARCLPSAIMSLRGSCILSALLPDDSCLYHGIQISSGNVFRPTDIIEDFQSTNGTIRDDCIECRCEVRQSNRQTHAAHYIPVLTFENALVGR